LRGVKEGKGRGGSQRGEMTQTLYAHVNKIKIKKNSTDDSISKKN
jgi:hypothetical protein